MRTSRRVLALLCVLAACALACASRGHPPASRDPSPADSASVSLPAACEAVLARLDSLLVQFAHDSTGFAADLAEARALRSEALESMANGDYALALDLLTSAVAVLEPRRP